MNILITGGAGFIGSSIAEAYIKQGHNVVIIDNLSTGFLENVHKGSTFYQMDIRDNGIYDILHEHKIDVINHHAAQIDVRRSVLDPKYDLSVNVMGSLNVIESGLKHGISRIIFASTGGAIYGEQEYFPADESHPTSPCSPYGITKLTVEKYLYFYSLEKKLTSTILRYTNVYGPRQNPHGEAGVVAIFCDKLLHKQNPTINGDGLQTRDYVFIDDVVRANLVALEMEDSETFNVCTGIETTVTEVFHILNDALGAPAIEKHGPEKPGEQRRSVCSHQKINSQLGWLPQIDISNGLKRTIEFFLNKFERE